jgi:hypothetical protein
MIERFAIHFAFGRQLREPPWTPSGRLPAPRLPFQRDRMGNPAATLGIVLVLVARLPRTSSWVWRPRHTPPLWSPWLKVIQVKVESA